MYAELPAQIAVSIREVFAPRVEKTVTQFAEESICLGFGQGTYRTNRCAYIREVLEDYRASGARDVTNCFGAQTFKSTSSFVGAAYRVEHMPTAMMLLYPTYEFAKNFSETKWMPIIENSPVLQKHLPRKMDRFKKLRQNLGKSLIHFVGAGAEKNLKGNSVEILVLDELDDIEAEYQRNGKSAIALAEARTKSFPSAKIFKTGTPTSESGAVWQSFMAGDRRLFFVECPKCKGKPFCIEFNPEHTKQYFPDVNAAKVVWDRKAKNTDGTWNLDAVAKSARLECPNCKRQLNQGELYAMVERGQWQPTVTSPNISRRLPSLYSPHEKTTLAALAVKYLTCQSRTGGLREFLNQELALPYQQKAFVVTQNDLRAVVTASPEYLIGTIPQGDISFLGLTVDINADFITWVIRAWYADRSSALVDYGKLLPNFSDVFALSQRSYKFGPNNFELKPMFCLIDSGYRPTEVYDFCLKSNGVFCPVKGAQKKQGLTKIVQESDIALMPQLKLIRFDDDVFKHDLYHNRIKNRVGGNWFLARNITPDYEEQLTDEYLRRDKTITKWDTKHDNNHLGDCEKYQLLIPCLLEDGLGKDALRILADRIKPKLTG